MAGASHIVARLEAGLAPDNLVDPSEAGWRAVFQLSREWGECSSIRQLIVICWREALLGVLHQALVNLLRRRGATLSSTVGVLLAITFISGTLIAIDSSARATLEAHIDGVSGDFSFNAGPGDYSEIRDIVSSVPGVTEVSMTRGGLGSEMGSPFVPFSLHLFHAG